MRCNATDTRTATEEEPRDMCGITGIVAPAGARVPTDRLQQMTDLIAHRGPDGEGFVLGSHFVRKAATAEPAQGGLGHRRLPSIDISGRGIQPISVAAGGEPGA